MLSKKVWFNGQLVDQDQARVSVFDHGLLYGDGVFEGIRCYNGRVFKNATHLKRLYDSATAIRLTIPYALDELAAAVRQTLDANQCRDGYIRLCVTRGTGTLGLNPFKCERPNVFVIADSIELYPAEYYRTGLSVVTAATIRNHPSALSPRIKSMNYLNNILAKIEALDAGVMESVMLNHQGNLAECTGENIFVVKHGKSGGVDNVGVTLTSPPSHAGVLEGVTLGVVIELAKEAGIAVDRADMTTYDLYTADEVFLTGTAAEVIPVTEVDRRPVGDGKPGLVTQRLAKAFHDLVAQDAPED